MNKSKKFIYKITNLVNNKSYIGQTTNWKRRFQEHRNKGYGQEENKVLYRAFDKYGINNFTFEVIEECEDYNEREKYWIKYFDSFQNGYNMTEGGEEPPLNTKEQSPFATHTQKQADEVIRLILTTSYSFKEIAEKTNYDSSAIERINKGQLWFDESLNYPLRKDHSPDFILERTLKIISDLQSSSLTQKEIAKKHGVSRSAVTMINIGENSPQPDIDYPIRKQAVTNGANKKVIMLDKETLEELQTFNCLNDAARRLIELKLSTSVAAASRSISISAKSNLQRISYGFKWKFVEEN